VCARAAAALALAWIAVAMPASALDSPAWPPSEKVAGRMKALQETLQDPKVTAAQRETAREELAGLLKSPAGQARGRTADEKPPRPARAAIDPYPSVVRPAPAPATPPPQGVAKLEVVDPPKPVVDPRTGTVLPRAGDFAIDPRTGAVLHATPGGFIDPRTGQFIPR
jgi:hypothetical protein